MKEADMAPSATTRRTRLGIPKAKMKQSAVTDVPRRSVMRWSRKYPQIRLIMVARVITEADLRICLVWVNRPTLRC
jgi:hypothetical protein